MAAHIRPGRHEDSAAIAAFTTDTFSWGDYVGDEFPRWLEEPATAVAVAVDGDDAPIAVARVRMLSPREGWLSAFRVHPAHRRSGLGSALNDWCADWVRRQGGIVCRLQSETTNIPAHNQVAKLAYRPVVSAVSARRPTQLPPDANGFRRTPAPERLARAPRAESDLAFIAWSTSELTRHARGMFALEPWAWRVLTEQDLRAGPLWACPSGWVIAEVEEDDLAVRWLCCTPDDVDRLIPAIVDLADDHGTLTISMALPEVAWLSAASTRLGFVDAYPTRIYEKPVT